MQPEATYDLVTLEPPPIGYAGVAALYSREFYALARSRLKPGGYLTQWLPTYQVPAATTLAMVRAFVDVFPGAVLLSGAGADLILIGGNGAPVQLDPDRLAAALARAPEVRADLAAQDLGTPTEIAGMFLASADTLTRATRDARPVTDDDPAQEYGVLSLLNFGDAVPSAIVDLDDLAAWCPRCFVDGKPAPAVQGLDLYMMLLRLAYAATPEQVAPIQSMEGREIFGSAYLGASVPESAELHNAIGVFLAGRGEMSAAVAEFERALAIDPQSANAWWHLGAAAAGQGRLGEAIAAMRRAVELDPDHAGARADLDALLAVQRSTPGGGGAPPSN
jgi:tetratricopeptide (TPR) repeat protein